MIGIGIDTGGTYTDAVAYDMDTKEILCSGKALTTKAQLEIGIANALDTLAEEYVKEAQMLALSTTLATNACVENKGSRAKLLMIGVDKEFMENSSHTYARYGFHDLTQLVVIDARPEKIYKDARDPDWQEFSRMIPKAFGECGCVGVVQMFPNVNGGRFEKTAKELMEKQLSVPITMAHEMFDDVDVLKRGAGTLLNARLIPIIEEFFKAVKCVLDQRGLHIPIAIVRSDGSLMSELIAREAPVETLLSGPAASVVGGGAMAQVENALIVDMGGTTTDIALIRDKVPVMARKGISIGKWKTMVKGLYVETFGLGGDSAVRYQKGKMFIDSQRVVPLSLLAQEYPQIIKKLKRLVNYGQTHTQWLHEFYVLQKDIAGKSGFTESEQRICAALKQEPLMTEELAAVMECDVYSLHTKRLEEEGVLIKSGLTPTDMMIIKGDFEIYDPAAAQLAGSFLARNINMDEKEIPDQVYDLVVKKMYCNIVRILLQQKYPKKEKICREKSVQKFVEWCYQDAKEAEKDPLLSMSFTTRMPLVGVGAPIHIFLPRVAQLLGTEVIIPDEAPVANALGAIASQVITKVQVRIAAVYEGAVFKGFSVFEGIRKHMFEEYADAEAFAVEFGKAQIVDKAQRWGSSQSPEVSIEVDQIRSKALESEIMFESIVTVRAMDQFQA